MTPEDWMPLIVCAACTPCKYGSVPKPSQFLWPLAAIHQSGRSGGANLPPPGILPNGPIDGPKSTLTPLFLASSPWPAPLLKANSRLKVAPTVNAAGHAVEWSTNRNPNGPSCKHSEGKPT